MVMIIIVHYCNYYYESIIIIIIIVFSWLWLLLIITIVHTETGTGISSSLISLLHVSRWFLCSLRAGNEFLWARAAVAARPVSVSSFMTARWRENARLSATRFWDIPTWLTFYRKFVSRTRATIRRSVIDSPRRSSLTVCVPHTAEASFRPSGLVRRGYWDERVCEQCIVHSSEFHLHTWLVCLWFGRKPQSDWTWTEWPCIHRATGELTLA